MRHYGQATVVFDGYGEGPSIKDNIHQRRGKNLHPIVSFTAETEFSSKKEDFLSRDKNKANMIALISTALTKRGCHVIQSPGDADVDIVKATVERSRHCTTTLVGEDTDLLILLLHYSKTDNEIIYFRSDPNKQSREHKVYNINLLKESLGDDVCNELLFVHAYSGCDSTSRIFDKPTRGDNTPWDIAIDDSCIDSSLSNWMDLFLCAVDEHVSQISIKGNNARPWIDKDLIRTL